ncbi:TTF-type domain-containing protein [Trichonephila clavipes]|nr:TTF-type domain-containing protein [Trichonephila clavipes]
MGTVIGNTLSSILHRHENIKEPMAHMFQWITLEKGIKHGRTLDQENERRILESQKHRYCSTSTRSKEEKMIGFFAVTETTGEYLTNAILGELGKNGLDIQNCRGQGYDNGANMLGKIRGFQTRI